MLLQSKGQAVYAGEKDVQLTAPGPNMGALPILFWGFLNIILVYWAPQLYSKY